MTQQTSLDLRYAAAKARLQKARDSLAARRLAVTRLEADAAAAAARAQADPKSVDLDQQRARAAADVRRETALIGIAENEVRAAERELAEVERLRGGDTALEKAREGWRIASAAQVEATKAAQAARDELARLDALLHDAEGEMAKAKAAQSTSILARLGFSKEPAAPVPDAELVLVGAAATVDALRTARPDLETKVAEAEAVMNRRDKETQAAVLAILHAKQAIAQRAALQALADCRAAVLAHHAATLAATGAPGERVVLYDQSEGEGWIERQAERLKANAFAGE